MTTSHLNTSGDGSQSVRSSSNVLIVGGKRSGEYIKWFGNRVAIDGVFHVLHRAYFTNGTHRRYYVLEGMDLGAHLHVTTFERIEVLG